MVPETPNTHEQLLPDRHPQHDLFICDVADAVLKDLIPSMEHPFYSLSKKPERCARRYEHNGNWIEVRPGLRGLATIYDKDILIYCVSQIMAKLTHYRKWPAIRRLRVCGVVRGPVAAFASAAERHPLASAWRQAGGEGLLDAACIEAPDRRASRVGHSGSRRSAVPFAEHGIPAIVTVSLARAVHWQ